MKGQKRNVFANMHQKETSEVNLRQASRSPLFNASTCPWDTSINMIKWQILSQSREILLTTA